MASQRRQFERFPLGEDTLAVDDSGRKLGRVVAAGGGGMSIALEDSSAVFAPGQRLRVTVVESARGIRNTIDVIVRYRHQNSMGVEFVTGKAAKTT